MASAGGNRPVYLAAAIVSIGGLLFGYDLLVASGAILLLRFAPETRGRSLEDIEASWHRGATSG